jgi:hypothetical protein
MDSNRAIAAPVVGDIKSALSAFNAAIKPGQISRTPRGSRRSPGASRRTWKRWRHASTPIQAR